MLPQFGNAFELGSIGQSSSSASVVNVDNFNVLNGSGSRERFVLGAGGVDVQCVFARATVDSVEAGEGLASSAVSLDGQGVDGIVTGGASNSICTSSERTCLPKPGTQAGQRVTGGLVGSFGTAPPLSHRQ